MKKKLLFTTLSLCLLCSCGTPANNATASNANSDSTNEVTDSPSNTPVVTEDTEIPVETEVPVETETPAETEENANIKTISIGDIITTDKFEVTINNIEFSYDVLPNDTSAFYMHYPADSGKVYIHIDTDVKNLQKQNIVCDSIMNVTADYDNGYTYTSQAIPEDASLGFNYANITSIDPLETLGVRYLIDAPQEVDESDKPLFLIFDVDGNKYQYTMR